MELLSINDAAKCLGIGRTKLYQSMKDGSLPAKKLGKRTFILRADLNNFISQLNSYSGKESQ